MSDLDRRQLVKSARALKVVVSQLAEQEPTPTQLALELRRRGFQSVTGRPLQRWHARDLLRAVRPRPMVARRPRPTRRSHCPQERPCPWVGCRYHLGMDVLPGGQLRFAPVVLWEVTPGGQAHGLPDVEQGDLHGLRYSCALDAGDHGAPISLEQQARLIWGITRQRAYFLYHQAERKVRDAEPEVWQWLRWMYDNTKAARKWSREEEG